MLQKKVEIKLSKNQMKQLAPLFEQVEASPMQGVVFGQAYEYGIAVFVFMKPDEVVERVKEVKHELSNATIKPAGWK